jgi:hypothetical protein
MKLHGRGLVMSRFPQQIPYQIVRNPAQPGCRSAHPQPGRADDTTSQGASDAANILGGAGLAWRASPSTPIPDRIALIGGDGRRFASSQGKAFIAQTHLSRKAQGDLPDLHHQI